MMPKIQLSKLKFGNIHPTISAQLEFVWLKHAIYIINSRSIV